VLTVRRAAQEVAKLDAFKRNGVYRRTAVARRLRASQPLTCLTPLGSRSVEDAE
jgi:hypothetical protein